MARSPEPSRAQAARDMPVSVQREAEGGMHKSLPLQACRESGAAAGAGAAALGVRPRTFPAAVPEDLRTGHAPQRFLLGFGIPAISDVRIT